MKGKKHAEIIIDNILSIIYNILWFKNSLQAIGEASAAVNTELKGGVINCLEKKLGQIRKKKEKLEKEN